MKILGLDTTKKSAEIVLYDGEILLEKLGENEKHSECLMTHIDEILNKNSLSLGDFDYFLVVTGPGSFTGIRVGLATIKGFNYPLNKKVIAVNHFDVASMVIDDGIFVIPNTVSSVYYAKIKAHKVIEMGVMEYSEMDKLSDIYAFDDNFIGDKAYNVNVLTNYIPTLIDVALLKIKNNDFCANLEPCYVQLSQAERNLVNGNKKG